MYPKATDLGNEYTYVVKDTATLDALCDNAPGNDYRSVLVVGLINSSPGKYIKPADSKTYRIHGFGANQDTPTYGLAQLNFIDAPYGIYNRDNAYGRGCLYDLAAVRIVVTIRTQAAANRDVSCITHFVQNVSHFNTPIVSTLAYEIGATQSVTWSVLSDCSGITEAYLRTQAQRVGTTAPPSNKATVIGMLDCSMIANSTVHFHHSPVNQVWSSGELQGFVNCNYITNTYCVFSGLSLFDSLLPSPICVGFKNCLQLSNCVVGITQVYKTTVVSAAGYNIVGFNACKRISNCTSAITVGALNTYGASSTSTLNVANYSDCVGVNNCFASLNSSSSPSYVNAYNYLKSNWLIGNIIEVIAKTAQYNTCYCGRTTSSTAIPNAPTAANAYQYGWNQAGSY
jgi:hypothetical protein